jgi:hypothetical protein
MQTATYVPGAKPEVPSSLGKIGLQDPARYSDGRLIVMVDRPGDLGGSDPWEDAESCLHSGSSSAVHITAAEGGDGIPARVWAVQRRGRSKWRRPRPAQP